MSNAIATKTMESQTATCAHYWVLEGDTAETTRGVCRNCGSIKEFQNHLPGDRYAKEWREARVTGPNIDRMPTQRSTELDY